MPEVLGVAFYFNYINRLVDTYLTRDATLPSMPWAVKMMFKTSLTKVEEKPSAKSNTENLKGIDEHESLLSVCPLLAPILLSTLVLDEDN